MNATGDLYMLSPLQGPVPVRRTRGGNLVAGPCGDLMVRSDDAYQPPLFDSHYEAMAWAEGHPPTDEAEFQIAVERWMAANEYSLHVDDDSPGVNVTDAWDGITTTTVVTVNNSGGTPILALTQRLYWARGTGRDELGHRFDDAMDEYESRQVDICGRTLTIRPSLPTALRDIMEPLTRHHQVSSGRSLIDYLFSALRELSRRR